MMHNKHRTALEAARLDDGHDVDHRVGLHRLERAERLDVDAEARDVGCRILVMHFPDLHAHT